MNNVVLQETEKMYVDSTHFPLCYAYSTPLLYQPDFTCPSYHTSSKRPLSESQQLCTKLLTALPLTRVYWRCHSERSGHRSGFCQFHRASGLRHELFKGNSGPNGVLSFVCCQRPSDPLLRLQRCSSYRTTRPPGSHGLRQVSAQQKRSPAAEGWPMQK